MSEYVDGLQIYAQPSWHHDAVIVGTREAITALRDRLTSALEGKREKALFFPSDGEGYEVKINIVSTDALKPLPSWYLHIEP